MDGTFNVASGISIALLLVSVSLRPAGAEDANAPPKSVEKARRIANEVLDTLRRPGKMPPQERAELPLPLLRFLDSDDTATRQVALDTFVDLLCEGWEIRLTECLPYLAPERPAKERAVLLALCLIQVKGFQGEVGGNESVEKTKALAKEALNFEICPPEFHLTALALASIHSVKRTSRGTLGLSVTELVEKTRARDVARRLLAALPAALATFGRPRPPDARQLLGPHPEREILETVIALGEEQVGQAVEDWCRSEPNSSLRGILLDEKLSWWKDPTWASRRTAILRLLSQDWDANNAARAKALLQKR